jgi:hypothetical protein
MRNLLGEPMQVEHVTPETPQQPAEGKVVEWGASMLRMLRSTAVAHEIRRGRKPAPGTQLISVVQLKRAGNDDWLGQPHPTAFIVEQDHIDQAIRLGDRASG